MKKYFVLVIIFSFFAELNAQSYSQNQNKKDSLNNYKKWSHWSITLEGGANKLDGDSRQTYNDVIPSALNRISLGGSLEYTLTPVWSMGLEYYYLPYQAIDPKGHYSTKGTMHSGDYFMAFNLQKWFFRNSTSKWGIWAAIGAGMAYYKADYITDGSSTENNQNYPDVSNTVKDGVAITIPIWGLIEYNLSKNFAIGTKIQYRSYNKDNVDGRNYRGVTNDFLELGTLQLRWKFNAINRNHTRNINLQTFEKDTTDKELNDIKYKVDSLQKNLAVITPLVEKHENFINKNAPEIEKIPDYNNRIKKLEDIICPDGPDTDNDGVPDCRDKEPDTPENTPVDFWGRTISAYDVNTATVFFDFDKTDLNEEAKRAIRYAANKLKSDPSLIVEVRGFTDNMGGEQYNEGLSQRRADKVKNELVKEYGINPKRIIANGKGKYNPDDKAIRYRPYRTAMFFYNK